MNRLSEGNATVGRGVVYNEILIRFPMIIWFSVFVGILYMHHSALKLTSPASRKSSRNLLLYLRVVSLILRQKPAQLTKDIKRRKIVGSAINSIWFMHCC